MGEPVWQEIDAVLSEISREIEETGAPLARVLYRHKQIFEQFTKFYTYRKLAGLFEYHGIRDKSGRPMSEKNLAARMAYIRNNKQ